MARTFQTQFPVNLFQLRMVFETDGHIIIQLVNSEGDLYMVHFFPKTFDESSVTGQIRAEGRFGILGFGSATFQQDGTGTVVMYESGK